MKKIIGNYQTMGTYQVGENLYVDIVKRHDDYWHGNDSEEFDETDVEDIVWQAYMFEGGSDSKHMIFSMSGDRPIELDEFVAQVELYLLNSASELISYIHRH